MDIIKVSSEMTRLERSNSLKSCKLIKIAMCLVATFFGINASAQTLPYDWNFNNSTGSGGALTTPPTYVDTADGYTGGVLAVAANASAGLATPFGSGVKQCLDQCAC
jgi:ABC-type Fe2+-enterobactin transport system substrate-binding protein